MIRLLGTEVGHAPRTAWNLASILGGEAMLRIANFVAAVIIARTQGPVIFGTYAVTLAYATIAMTIVDSGIQTAIVKEIGADPANASKTYSTFAAAKILLTVAALAALGILGYLLNISPIVWSIGLLVTVRTAVQSYCQFQAGALKAINQMSAVGAIQVAHCVLLLCAFAVAFTQREGILVLLTILVLGQLFELLSGTILLTRFRVTFTRISFKACVACIKNASPIGVTSVLAAAVLRLDVIILTWIADPVVVGEFAAAQSVITIVYVMSWLLSSVILPDLVKIAGSATIVRAYLKRWLRLILFAGAPVATLASASAVWMTPVIFGPNYPQSAPILAVLLLASPLIIFNSVYLAAAIALDQKRFYLPLCLAAATLSVVCNIVLGRIWTAVGVALSVVLREAFACSLNAIHFHKDLG